MTGQVVRQLRIYDARSRPADEATANADAPSDREGHPGRLALLSVATAVSADPCAHANAIDRYDVPELLDDSTLMQLQGRFVHAWRQRRKD